MKKVVNDGVLEGEWYLLGGETETVSDASIVDAGNQFYLAYGSEEDFLVSAKPNGVLTLSGNFEVGADIKGMVEEDLHGTVKMEGTQCYTGEFSAQRVEISEGSDVTVEGEIFDFETMVVNGRLSIDFEQLYSLTSGGKILGDGVLQIRTEGEWVVNQSVYRDFSGFTGRVEMTDPFGRIVLGAGDAPTESPLGIEDSYFSDEVTVVIQGGQQIVLTGEHVAAGYDFVGDGTISVIDDMNLSGDLSGFTGTLQVTSESTVTLSGTISGNLSLDGGHVVLEENISAAPVKVEVISELGSLEVGDQKVILVGGTIDTVTGEGILDLTEYSGETISFQELDLAGGTILVNSDHSVVIEDNISGYLVVELGENPSGPAVIYRGDEKLNQLEGIVLRVDDAISLPDGYSFLELEGRGALPEHVDIYLEVNGIPTEMIPGRQKCVNGEFFTVERGENGEIVLKGTDLFTKIFVSEQWDGEESGEVLDCYGDAGSTTTRYLGHDAAESLEKAVEYLVPDEQGKGIIELVENGTYHLNSILEEKNEVKNLVLKSRDNWGNAMIEGPLQIEGADSLVLVNLSAKNSILGCGELSVHGTRDNRFSGDFISGGGKVEIEGGIYTSRVIAAGGVDQVTQESSQLILHGEKQRLSVASDLFGGNIGLTKDIALQQNQQSSVLIDVTSQKKMMLSGGIYAAGYAAAGTTYTVDADRRITFTGEGDNLTFTGRVSGGGKGITVNSGKATLCFDNYTGNFSGAISDFDQLVLQGDTALTLARRQVNCQDMEVNFTVNADSSASSYAMYTVRDGKHWEFGKNISVTVDQAEYGDYLLVDHYLGEYEDFQFTINGVNANLAETLYMPTVNAQYQLRVIDDQLRLSYQPYFIQSLRSQALATPPSQQVPELIINTSLHGYTGQGQLNILCTHSVASDIVSSGLISGGGTLGIEGGRFDNMMVAGGVNKVASGDTAVIVDGHRDVIFRDIIVCGNYAKDLNTRLIQTENTAFYVTVLDYFDVLLLKDIYLTGYASDGAEIICSGDRLASFTGKGDNLTLPLNIYGGSVGSHCTVIGGKATLEFKDYSGPFRTNIHDFDQISIVGDSHVTSWRLPDESAQKTEMHFVLNENSSSQGKAFYQMDDGASWKMSKTIAVQTTGNLHSGSYTLVGNVSLDINEFEYVFQDAHYAMSEQVTGNDICCWMNYEDKKLSFNYLKNNTLTAGEILRGDFSLNDWNDVLTLDIDSSVLGNIHFGGGVDQLSITGVMEKSKRETTGAKLLTGNLTGLEKIFVDEQEISLGADLQLSGTKTVENLSDDLWCRVTLAEQGLIVSWGQAQNQLQSVIA